MRCGFASPSPASGLLGGVAQKSRETIVVLEAAGFDVVLIETVGVGQSESQVADMVDFFLVLLLAGAGDALQGIKKGVLEIADLLVVNKADGEFFSGLIPAIFLLIFLFSVKDTSLKILFFFEDLMSC